MSDHGRLHDELTSASEIAAANCQVDTSCFDDDGTRRLLELVTRQVLLTASLTGIDLAGLDGVTFSRDCEATVARMQYVPEGTVPLERSRPPGMLEMGQTVAVKRGDRLCFHLVLRAGLGVMALSAKRDDQELVHLCFAHEAAHVDHEANLQSKFPELHSAPAPDFGQRSRMTFLKAIDVWSEYAACRSSALFRPSALENFEDAFFRGLTTAFSDCKQRIVQYRHDGNAVAAFHDVQQIIGDAFIDAGYFLGHLDGIEGAIEAAPRVAMLLAERSDLNELIQRLRRTLRTMWLSEYGWESLNVFEPIYDVIRDAMAINGVVFARRRGEWRIVMCEDGGAESELKSTLESWAAEEN